MKADVQRMLGVAVITCGITLAAFWPAFTNATDDGTGITPKIETPILKAGGVEIRVVPAEDRTYKSGDEPVFALTAVNKTDQPTSVTVETLMNATSRPPRLSRTMARPMKLWVEPTTLLLGPKESKTITETTHTPLPENWKIEVSVHTMDSASNPVSNDTNMMSFNTFVASDSLR